MHAAIEDAVIGSKEALPTVTVIIPARNEDEYIEACLQSVLAQDYPRIELIVVDNGSTDRTAEIAASLGARVVFEAIPGLPRTRETGRLAATGEILVYFDADMLIPPGYLTQLIELFRQRPDMLAASTPFRFYDGNWMGNRLIALNFAIYKAMHVLNITRFLFGGSFAVRSEAMTRIGGFNTDIEFYGEDTDLSKRLAKCGGIEFYDRLRSMTSARRYVRQGIVKTCLLYFSNYLAMLAFGRTVSFAMPKFIRLPQVRNSAIGMFTLLFLLYGAVYPESKVFGRVMYDVKSPHKVVALTFDDGPNGRYTEEVLRILREEKVKGTFFLVGRNVEAYPALARQIAQDGHSIGNHSYRHAWKMPFTSKSQVIREIDRADAAIYRATGKHTKLFRAPHGLRTPWMVQAVRDEGYQVVTWDDLASDYSTSFKAESLAKTISRGVHPGSIILLHDGENLEHGANRQNSVDALRLIIRELKAKGYSFTAL